MSRRPVNNRRPITAVAKFIAHFGCPPIPKWIATGRVRALLLRIAEEECLDLDAHHSGSHDRLAFHCGIGDRALWRLLNEEGPTTNVNTLETIINASNRLELRWMEPSEGGFRDVFDGEPQIIPQPTAKQIAHAQKHNRQRHARLASHAIAGFFQHFSQVDELERIAA